jgi:hypothetical protein
MSKRKKYGYKNLHVKKELWSQLDEMRRSYGFVSFTELIVYLRDREAASTARKINCNCNYGK